MRKSISTGVVLAITSTAVFTGVASAASGPTGNVSIESPWPSVPVSGPIGQLSPTVTES
jgi:hypothetical protein